MDMKRVNVDLPLEVLKLVEDQGAEEFRTVDEMARVLIFKGLGLNGRMLQTTSTPIKADGRPRKRTGTKRTRGFESGKEYFGGRKSAQFVKDGRKLCSLCRIPKKLNERNFHRSKPMTSGFSSQCRKCYDKKYLHPAKKK
jgi:hypothetical protein